MLWFRNSESPLGNYSAKPNKSFLHLWNKNFLMEIFRNIQIFAFQVLQECSSRSSRNGAVQMLFLTPSRKMFAGTFFYYILNFWLFYKSLFFTMLSEFRFVKRVRFFEGNCVVKWAIISASFCWLWDVLQENLKLKDKLQIWGFASFMI